MTHRARSGPTTCRSEPSGGSASWQPAASVGSSQDAVVETAVERLYDQVRADEDARRWAEAAEDRDFRTEMAAIARELDEPDRWPA